LPIVTVLQIRSDFCATAAVQQSMTNLPAGAVGLMFECNRGGRSLTLMPTGKKSLSLEKELG